MQSKILNSCLCLEGSIVWFLLYFHYFQDCLLCLSSNNLAFLLLLEYALMLLLQSLCAFSSLCCRTSFPQITLMLVLSLPSEFCLSLIISMRLSVPTLYCYLLPSFLPLAPYLLPPVFLLFITSWYFVYFTYIFVHCFFVSTHFQEYKLHKVIKVWLDHCCICSTHNSAMNIIKTW